MQIGKQLVVITTAESPVSGEEYDERPFLPALDTGNNGTGCPEQVTATIGIGAERIGCRIQLCQLG